MQDGNTCEKNTKAERREPPTKNLQSEGSINLEAKNSQTTNLNDNI